MFECLDHHFVMITGHSVNQAPKTLHASLLLQTYIAFDQGPPVSMYRWDGQRRIDQQAEIVPMVKERGNYYTSDNNSY